MPGSKVNKLFDCSTDISLHLRNIFNSGELDEEAVTEKSSATASNGKVYPTKFLIWTQSYLLVIGLILKGQHNFGNGQPVFWSLL